MSFCLPSQHLCLAIRSHSKLASSPRASQQGTPLFLGHELVSAELLHSAKSDTPISVHLLHTDTAYPPMLFLVMGPAYTSPHPMSSSVLPLHALLPPRPQVCGDLPLLDTQDFVPCLGMALGRCASITDIHFPP